MLELVGISRQAARKNQEPLAIVSNVSFTAPGGHALAVLGPTGSGKTSLLEVICGLARPSHGTLVWHGRDMLSRPPHPNEFGFVPKEDDVLHDALSVQENIVSALLLRVRGTTRQQAMDQAGHLMVATGIEMNSKQRAGTLTAPQRRRLKLAVALVSNPSLVICDDFTDGLDAKSERELAALLQLISRDQPGRLVINATQSMANLSCYDSVVLLYEGHLCFHGPSRALPHYFSVKQLEEIYPRAAKRPAHRWGESWDKHRDTYYNAFKLGGDPAGLAAASEADESAEGSQAATAAEGRSGAPAAFSGTTAAAPVPHSELPSFASRTHHLLLRRWTEFRRRMSDWLVHALLLLGLPLVAALMGWRHRDLYAAAGSGAEAQMQLAYAASMLILAQVIFAMLMAARNGAPEIAGERGAFERERLGGLGAGPYLTAKLIFLLPIMLAQGAWLGLCVDMITGGLPGQALMRIGLLTLTIVGFTLLSLALSATAPTREAARLRTLWLLIAQVPLCGALLAPPGPLDRLLQPLMTAYAGWSGCLHTLPATVIAAFDKLNGTWLAAPSKACALLAAHAVLGLVVAAWGVARRRR